MNVTTKVEVRDVSEHEQKTHAVPWASLLIHIFLEDELAHKTVTNGPVVIETETVKYVSRTKTQP